MSRAQYLKAALDDIDPMKHVGEGWGAVDEYFPQDVNAHLRGDISEGGEGYYPPPKKRKK